MFLWPYIPWVSEFATHNYWFIPLRLPWLITKDAWDEKKAWGNPLINSLSLVESRFLKLSPQYIESIWKKWSQSLLHVLLSLCHWEITKSKLTSPGFTLPSASSLVPIRILSENISISALLSTLSTFLFCSQLSSFSNYPQKESYAISIYYIRSVQKINPHIL